MTDNILKILREEKERQQTGSFYHFSQLSFGYNSNKMEGSTLTSEQTQMLFDENALYPQNNKVDYYDIIEMKNHFKLFDYLLDTCHEALTQEYIKSIHKMLKNNSKDEILGYPIGEYKNKPNIISSTEGHTKTSPVKSVSKNLQILLEEFSSLDKIGIEDIIDFHVKFERVHPFQDGNGRVGRIIMFKQCLEHEVVPFIIEDRFKASYIKGVKEWDSERGYLKETCLYAQDIYAERFNNYLDFKNEFEAKEEK